MSQSKGTLAYFPGCSLKDNAKRFEDAALFVMETLGAPLEELETWNCCGTVYSLADDDLMHHIASVRNFIRTQEADSEEVVTLCAMCYNTLARVAARVNADEEERTKINAFMNEEPDYEGGVRVRHVLQVLRDTIGWDALSEAVVRPLEGLKIAAYYGCTLVRPKETGIDDMERPVVMADALEAVGAEPVAFPFEAECCGTYQIVDEPHLALEQSSRILRSAALAGAHVVVTACPLCQHNLEQALEAPIGLNEEGEKIQVVYFTELLAAALGADEAQMSPAVREVLSTSVTAEGGT
jgi:heterodisulfide reductase subunit B